jgi:hypothetical protein
MNTHTAMRMKHQTEYTGDDWLIAVVEFGTQPNGKNLRGYITTDHVPASEIVYGDPEADLRLWSAASALLEAAQGAIAALSQPHTYPADIEAAKTWLARAVAKATEASQ